MLPVVTLKDVGRDDVDRIAWWLEDEAVSSRWFGHYACGDPVHRGYDPEHMIEAPQAEWERVFGDPNRLIFSVYSEKEEHIGEAQVVLDGEGGGELSLLIGRKDLWHHGYGTSTVITLLDKIFTDFGLDRAWVSVDAENEPALGLFQKLGFEQEATRELCKRPDGTTLKARILVVSASSYRSRSQEPMPAVTITGLPGSGSEVVGAEAARMLGSDFIDDEISEMLRGRLQCTAGDLQWFETSSRSFWTRLLGSIVVPVDWPATSDASYRFFSTEYDLLEDQVTKKRYLEALAGLVKKMVVEGSVVLHGHGSHLYVPPEVAALNVFVSASPAFRQQRIAASEGLSSEEALLRQKRLDREMLSTFKHLFSADPLDMTRYDIILNMDRLSFKTAAQVLVGALKIATPSVKLATAADLSLARLA